MTPDVASASGDLRQDLAACLCFCNQLSLLLFTFVL